MMWRLAKRIYNCIDMAWYAKVLSLGFNCRTLKHFSGKLIHLVNEPEMMIQHSNLNLIEHERFSGFKGSRVSALDSGTF
jgi:hypothetical protein